MRRNGSLLNLCDATPALQQRSTFFVPLQTLPSRLGVSCICTFNGRDKHHETTTTRTTTANILAFNVDHPSNPLLPPHEGDIIPPTTYLIRAIAFFLPFHFLLHFFFYFAFHLFLCFVFRKGILAFFDTGRASKWFLFRVSGGFSFFPIFSSFVCNSRDR